MKKFFKEESEEGKKKEAKKILGNLIQTSENYLYLIGAGCSVKSGGKIMTTLWTEFKSSIANFETLKDKTGYSGKNLEELLTKIKTAESYFESLGTTKITEKDEMKSFREEIENKLKEHCRNDIILGNDSIHGSFISKITNSRKLSHPRTKVFTLNYDTLFETAGNKGGYTIIDGFSFSIPRTFDGTKFDLDIVKRNKNYLEKEDNFEKKVFHLYKLHGSINWEEDNKGNIIQKDGAEGKLIYPGSSKYEESYDMPYFEMISRFQQELRKENVTLNIIGYSFSDSHINSMILEAFKTNPSLRLVIVGTSIFDETNKNIKEEKVQILNEGLKMDRVFLFNMYFEPFVDLLPLKEIKTREEIMLESLKKFNNPTTS